MNIAQPNINYSNNTTINKLIMLESRPSYDDIYIRPYTIQADVNTLRTLNSLIYPHVASSETLLNPIDISHNIPNVININNNISNVAHIENGWGTKRLLFMLLSESHGYHGITQTYAQGYSEYYDTSYSGLIDPNLKFKINSITTALKIVDSNTGIYNIFPQASYNLLIDNSVNHIDNMKLIRPKDVFLNLYLNNEYAVSDSILNNSDNINNSLKICNRKYLDGNNYFTTVVNSFMGTRSTIENHSPDKDIYKSAMLSSSDNNKSIITNPFINALSKISNELLPTYFTINTLLRINPNLKDVTTTILNSDTPIVTSNSILESENTMDTLNPIIESSKAIYLNSVLSSVLTTNLLTTVSFSATNETGEDIVIINNMNSFMEGIDITKAASNLASYIKMVILPKLSELGTFIYSIHVHSDILQDTSIAISINNRGMILFRFPSFADANYIPVIGNYQDSEEITNNFQSVMEYSYKMQL